MAAEHLTPHAPQLSGSLFLFTHASAQQVRPESLHVPAEHAPPPLSAGGVSLLPESTTESDGPESDAPESDAPESDGPESVALSVAGESELPLSAEESPAEESNPLELLQPKLQPRVMHARKTTKEEGCAKFIARAYLSAQCEQRASSPV